MRIVALIIEIASALTALGCLIALASHLARWLRAGRPEGEARAAWHVTASVTMCGAALIHGATAMIYDSGAPAAAYMLGWAAAASFALSGLAMMRPARAALGNTVGVHIALFALGACLVVAHAVVGRL